MLSFREYTGAYLVGQIICIQGFSALTMCLAEHIVKVPEMAESITEGTLKQWSKRG